MKKIDKRTVYNYIYGNDIEEYTLEELEKNPNFMAEVIKTSKDKNFYNYIDEELKGKYIIMKSLVETFPGDESLLEELLSDYIKKEQNELNVIEVLIQICTLTNKDSDIHIKSKLVLKTKYLQEKIELTILKEKVSKDKDLQKQLGEGFYIIYDKYKDRKIILDYYAKEMLNDILPIKTLEEQLHKEFKEATDLNNIKLKTYIINKIINYDALLSSYLSTNTNLLEDTITSIKEIKQNWDKYKSMQERELYKNVYEVIHTYLYYTHPESGQLFNEEEILYSLGEELNITNIIKKYDKVDEIYYHLVKETIKEHPKESYTKEELKHYNKIKQLVQKVLNGEQPKDAYTIDEKVIMLKSDNPPKNSRYKNTSNKRR